jgi:hypothetical protein
MHALITAFADGRWQVCLRVVHALSLAGIVTSTDTRGVNGQYTVSVDRTDLIAAQRIVATLEITQ